MLPINKVAEGRPHIVDMIKNGEIALIVNTVEESRTAVRDSYAIRRAALQARVTLYHDAGRRARRRARACKQIAGCMTAYDRAGSAPPASRAVRRRPSQRDRTNRMMAKAPLTVIGAEKLRAELQELKTVQRPGDHRGDRRGARARRPVGERRVRARPRSARASSKAASPKLESKLSNAQIIDPALLDADGGACSARRSSSKTWRTAKS